MNMNALRSTLKNKFLLKALSCTLLLICLPALGDESGGQCPSCHGYACPHGGDRWFASCDCDEYGCTLPGPPYMICFSHDCDNNAGIPPFWLICARWGHDPFPCDNGEVRGCTPITGMGLECPCSGWECWFLPAETPVEQPFKSR